MRGAGGTGELGEQEVITFEGLRMPTIVPSAM